MVKKILVKAMLGLFVLSGTIIPSFAQEWIGIGPGHYIDAHSLQPTRDYGAFTYVTKYVAEPGRSLEVVNGKAVATINTTSYMNCASNYAKTLSYTAYDAKGRVVNTGKNIGKHWYNIDNPGSRAYESFMFVCTDKYLRSRPYYNNFWYY